MLDRKEEDAPVTGPRVVWYLQHDDFRKDNPDGLAMAEINLP
jgi:hypothetical protein